MVVRPKSNSWSYCHHSNWWFSVPRKQGHGFSSWLNQLRKPRIKERSSTTAPRMRLTRRPRV